jgi:hypothetical protein
MSNIFMYDSFGSVAELGGKSWETENHFGQFSTGLLMLPQVRVWIQP